MRIINLCSPIHIPVRFGRLQETLKRPSHVAGNIDSLDFQRAKIRYLSSVIVCNKNDIYITGGPVVLVSQPDFRQGRPCCIWLEKEICSISSNCPFLPKPDGAGDHCFAVMEHGARSKWIVCLVLCAVRDFVIEWAKSVHSVPRGDFRLVVAWKPEHLGKWVKGQC